MDDKELNKISKNIAKIFKTNKWTWAIRKGLNIPTAKEVKESILSLIEDVKKEESWVSNGRLRVEKEDNGYDILVEADEFHIDD